MATGPRVHLAARGISGFVTPPISVTLADTMTKGISNLIQPATDPVLQGVTQHTGALDAQGLTCAIVVSRFNPDLTQGLLTAAVKVLRTQGMAAGDIDVAWVPGAFEIPTVLEQRARQQRWDMLLALGAVLEGQTPHAQAINRGVSRSLLQIARTHGVPVIDGVVCALSAEQAAIRCLGTEHNRGTYAAQAGIEMARLMKALTLSPDA